MTLPYSYETGKTSASVNWKPGAGNGRKVTGITIHHWGSSKGLDFDGIVNFLCSPRPANPTSAHYVAQGRDGRGNVSQRVACIVDPDDIAYACGNWSANLSQISIECRPECGPEDREVVAQLIAKLRATYGPLPLVGHQHWVPDDCPGTNWMANLGWLDQRAKQIAAGTAAPSAPTPTPAPPKEPDMQFSDVIPGTNPPLTVGQALGRGAWAYAQVISGGSIDKRINAAASDLGALRAAVTAGNTAEAQAILDRIEVSLTVKPTDPPAPAS